MRGLEAIDVEAANQPTYRPRRLSPLLSPRLLKGRTIPRPISRLVAFVVLVFSGVMLLQSLSEAFFPAATPEEPMSVVNNHYVAPQAAAMHYRPLVAGVSPISSHTQNLTDTPSSSPH
jgi:hypothetical protein